VYVRCAYTTRQRLEWSGNLEWQRQPYACEQRHRELQYEAVTVFAKCAYTIRLKQEWSCDLEWKLHVKWQYKAAVVYARRVYTTRWRHVWRSRLEALDYGIMIYTMVVWFYTTYGPTLGASRHRLGFGQERRRF
jgi:hypothetical protein